MHISSHLHHHFLSILSYGQWKGSTLNADGLWELIEGLEKNGLLQYDYLLTGYMGSPQIADTMVRIVAKLREYNPNLQYVCDPVLGDNGKLSVLSTHSPTLRS